jgi:hypothetical protein
VQFSLHATETRIGGMLTEVSGIYKPVRNETSEYYLRVK